MGSSFTWSAAYCLSLATLGLHCSLFSCAPEDAGHIRLRNVRYKNKKPTETQCSILPRKPYMFNQKSTTFWTRFCNNWCQKRSCRFLECFVNLVTKTSRFSLSASLLISFLVREISFSPEHVNSHFHKVIYYVYSVHSPATWISHVTFKIH